MKLAAAAFETRLAAMREARLQASGNVRVNMVG
jgi:hypothetical protein